MTLIEFGKILKDLREEKGYELTDMERKFNFRSELIFLLEKGDPVGTIFVRDILEKYQDLFQPKFRLYETYQNLLISHNETRRASLRDLHLLSLRNFFAVFVFVLAGYFVYSVAASFAAPEVLVLNFGGDVLTVSDAHYVLQMKVIPRDVTIYVNGESYFPDTEGFFEKELFLDKGVTTLEIRAVNRIGTETRLTKQLVFPEENIKNK